MHAFVLIGGENSRKSSVCRALTGVSTRSIREVETQGGKQLRMYICPNALQEYPTSPQDFVEEVVESGVRSTLFCLWPHADLDAPHDYPRAQNYLEQLIDLGWNIERIADLGQANLSLDGRLPSNRIMTFPESHIQPANATAAAVRAFFDWV